MSDLTAYRKQAASLAASAVSHAIKRRARYYLRYPGALEALHPGLSRASPEALSAVAAHILDRESRAPRRWQGFGGEIGLINAKAACLVGRAQRRVTCGHHAARACGGS